MTANTTTPYNPNNPELKTAMSSSPVYSACSETILQTGEFIMQTKTRPFSHGTWGFNGQKDNKQDGEKTKHGI